jgi:L-ascorbate metabolism protein UlaG (beta-lactamase superfamily)
MKLKFLAHASFLLTATKGTKVIIDPYKPGCFNNALRYNPINEEANIVLISHDHDDHNAIEEVLGNPQIIKEPGNYLVNDIKITGIKTFHDTQKGKARGKNLVFMIEIDGIKLLHLGDLGENLEPSLCKTLGKINVLLIPVGGYFTIDVKVATEICQAISPNILIPMHYKTQRLDFPIATVDEFLKDKSNVKKIDVSEVEINKEKLPCTTEIWVLQMSKL